MPVRASYLAARETGELLGDLRRPGCHCTELVEAVARVGDTPHQRQIRPPRRRRRDALEIGAQFAPVARGGAAASCSPSVALLTKVVPVGRAVIAGSRRPPHRSTGLVGYRLAAIG